jgi:hypothetical protein
LFSKQVKKIKNSKIQPVLLDFKLILKFVGFFFLCEDMCVKFTCWWWWGWHDFLLLTQTQLTFHYCRPCLFQFLKLFFLLQKIKKSMKIEVIKWRHLTLVLCRFGPNDTNMSFWSQYFVNYLHVLVFLQLSTIFYNSVSFGPKWYRIKVIYCQ